MKVFEDCVMFECDEIPETAACPECEAEGAVFLGVLGRERWFRCRCCAWTFTDGAGRDDELTIEVEPCPIGYQAIATNRYDGAPDGDRRVGCGATPAEAEAALRELYEENEHD